MVVEPHSLKSKWNNSWVPVVLIVQLILNSDYLTSNCSSSTDHCYIILGTLYFLARSIKLMLTFYLSFAPLCTVHVRGKDKDSFVSFIFGCEPALRHTAERTKSYVIWITTLVVVLPPSFCQRGNLLRWTGLINYLHEDNSLIFT